MHPSRIIGVAARFWILLGILIPSTMPRAEGAASTPASRDSLQQEFDRTVRPFLERYCFDCHNSGKRKGDLDLTVFQDVAQVAVEYRRWDLLVDKLTAKEMPPEDAGDTPTPALRSSVVEWFQAFRGYEAERTSGDPGRVLARRLSHAEYDNTIRDLTGVDIRPAHEFPVDPANEAGFDNSGESLVMSPTLLEKYVEAARRVADHLVLKPEGFDFAPHPMTTEPDRDKYCVKRIVDFYRRQPTEYAGYFMAAWRYLHRAELGQPGASLSDFAAEARLSPKYLNAVWSALAETREDEAGPLAVLRRMWRELPAAPEIVVDPRGRDARSVPDRSRLDAPAEGCHRMSEFVVRVRERLIPEVGNLRVRGIAAGSQPLVLRKDREMAANRMRYLPGRGPMPGPGVDGRSGVGIVGEDVEGALRAPDGAGEREPWDAALVRFCRLFPDAFFVEERGLVFLAEDKESQGRLLSAGFHLMVGYFRDDAPLCEWILDAEQRQELDQLWAEFDFITAAPLRQYKDFIFFERAEPPRFMQGAEFDFARSEDLDVTSTTKIRRLEAAYLAKARRNGGEGDAIEAIEDYFRDIAARIQWVETTRSTAEAGHLQSLLAFAERAYRRPLSSAEQDDLVGFHRRLRDGDGLNHEEALRDALVSILLSPHFFYRVQPSQGPGVRPLSGHELASRLSYFLWSSMPDAPLLAHAAAGDLRDPAILVAEARRMLQDERASALATEFGGNWLDFRRFEEHNAVDRERFESFDNALRQAMFEEPVRFFLDVARQGRPVLDFLYGDHTFVNRTLARHYGIPETETDPAGWSRLENARAYGRGGLLPMAVFLTKNAPGLRTSPVKRGYWVVRRLLGETIPPPPPSVPELPSDEAKLGEMTLREVLARHRADPNCAGCHDRFDGLGLVFEDYGPIGELRTRDLAGHAVDNRATFPDGSEGAGLDGLRGYLRGTREQEFIDNLCRKLLAYGLGRTPKLSDESTIHRMAGKLAADGYRFDSLVESIITSPQFLNQGTPTDSRPE